MNAEFTKEEVEIITALLEKELDIIPVEIHHTRTREFKDFLKERSALLEKILMKFKKEAA